MAGPCIVAPFAGAWIEIINIYIITFNVIVAPFAGAWIEITQWLETSDIYYRRSLRGSVD